MWPRSRIDRLLLILLAVGCRQDMHDSPHLEPLEQTTFFGDGRASRHPVDGTVARGQLNNDIHFHEGRRVVKEPALAGQPPETELVDAFPYEVTRSMLLRGRERYDIFCSPCHARTGNGDGMVVRRGYTRPPSLHTDRLRNAPVGHLYDVITRGFGAMPAYSAQIPPADRWAIVAYERALQLSQNGRLEDLPAHERKKLESAP